MIYLAQPYSHKSVFIRSERFEAGVHVAALLMGRGHVVISPIAHSHPIYMRHPETGSSFDQWQELDETLIDSSEEVWVLTLDGWQESYGVGKEIEFAKRRGIPVKYIDTSGDFVNP